MKKQLLIHGVRKTKRRILLLQIFFLVATIGFGASITYAQTVSGTVKDDSGMTLPGVNVLEKGTTNGSTTDSEGKFTINLKNGNATLAFSFIGFVTQEVQTNGITRLDVTMVSDLKSLDEVVVVGYGTQSARNITSAMGKISTKEISQIAVLSLDQALTGRVAGLRVTEDSAEPGGEISLRVRGIASITSGSNPLIVVDGIPMSVSLNAINPNDIQTIDVLKDAAATSIYGSRASAGVILVTTKRGKAGKIDVSFDAYTGIQQVSKKIPLLNGAQFAKLANENLVNGGQIANPEWSDPSTVLNTDWQDEIFRSAPIHNYNVSVSGGSEKMRAFTSFGYIKQEGIINRSDFERYTARVNLDFEISKKVRAGINLNYSQDKKNNARTQEEFWGVLLNAMRARPTDPVRSDVDGNINDHLYGFRGWALPRSDRNGNYYTLDNPVFTNQYWNNNSTSTQLLTNAFLEADLIKGLTFKTTIGYNLSYGFSKYGADYKLPAAVDPTSRSSVNEGWSNGVQWNWVNTLTYTKNINLHNFTFLIGNDALKGTGRGVNVSGLDQPENQPSISATALASRQAGGAPYPDFALSSYFGRASYDYNSKYLLSATVRRDGSSKFAPANRYGTFGSVSAGWRISEESFMRSLSFVDDLKLRGSYGSVGNQNIPDFQYLSTYGNDGGNFGYSFGSPPTLVPGLRPSILGNPDIKWETNVEANIGLDAAFLENKFTLSIDYYKKELKDLLGTVPISLYAAPFNGQITQNAFTMENSGIEITAGFNQKIGEVNLNINANFSTVNNEVTGLVPGNTSGFLSQSISMIGSAYNDGNAQTRTYVGERIGNFWGYETDGIIQNADELATSGMLGFGAKVGDRRFKDLNGDGVVTDQDKTFLGNGLPGYVYGINIGAQYKSFDVSIFGNGQGDVQIANMTKGVLEHMRFHNSTGIVNGSTDLLNSWDGEGSSNTFPRNSYDAPTSNRFFSDHYIENGAFFRIRNIQLGYAFPSALLNKVGISFARLYVTGQNLITISDYSGYDPEVGSATIGTRVQTAGVDYGRFPKAKMYTVGLNLKF